MTKGKGKTPGSGGLLKHITRRPHKERLQPEERRHLGHLEKHRDYVSRAKIYHMKEDKIKDLEKQVAQRNPDEFHFEMIHGSVDGRSGKHIAGSDAKRSTVQQVALNSKDIRYLEFRRNMLRGEISKRRQESHLNMRPSRSGANEIKLTEGEYQRSAQGKLSETLSCVHTRFVYASDDEFHTKVPQVDSVPPTAEDPDGAPHTNEFGAENDALLADRVNLYRRINKVLNALKLQTNLIKKGRRKKVNGPNGAETYRWLTTRRRN